MRRLPPALMTGSPEAKYVDFPPGNANQQLSVLDTTYNIDTINLMQEGSSNYNRLGRRIRMKSIQITGSFFNNGATVIVANEAMPQIRLALVYDRNPSYNGTISVVPAYNEIWQMRSQLGAATNYEWAANNVDNQSRFIILRDCRVTFPTNFSGSTDQIALTMNNAYIEGNQCKLFKKLRGLETNFRSNSNPTTIGDVQSGALYFISISNLVPATQASISFKWTARLRFYDAL